LSNKSGLKLEKSFLDPSQHPDLKISQPENGYRFSMDPLVLVSQIKLEGITRVLEIGCGCGIISLLLARRSPLLSITGIEIQKELYEYAIQNVRDNQYSTQINVRHADINKIALTDLTSEFDLLVSNPPYKKKNTGRLNPNSQKAIARHEVCLNLDQLFYAANRMLHENGKIALIYPADRQSDLETAMDVHGFWSESIQMVHTHQNSPAKRIILSASKNKVHPCIFHPPIYL